MLDLLNRILLAPVDLLLGWSLTLSSDLTLVLVALASAGILVGIRRFTTDQDLLARCHRDKKRLKELIKEARARKDKEAVRRHKAVGNLIGLKTFKAEGRPLLFAIVPIALLATWCFQRLEFHPPKADEPIEVVASFPISAAGKIAHMVPEDGLRAENGWIREIAVDESAESPRAVTTWILQAEAKSTPYNLLVRCGDETAKKELLVGGRHYASPANLYDGTLQSVEIQMKPLKLFGVIPGFPAIFFPPWLVAYLLLVFPLVPLLKRVSRIY